MDEVVVCDWTRRRTFLSGIGMLLSEIMVLPNWLWVEASVNGLP